MMKETRKIRFYRWLFQWLLNRLSWEMHFVVIPKDLAAFTKETTAWMRKRYPDAGGAALRREAEAQIMKFFPQYSRRLINKAIEVLL